MISRRHVIASTLFLGAACTVSGGAIAVRERQRGVAPGRERLLDMLPDGFDGWHHAPTPEDVIDPIVTDAAFATALALYDRIVVRNYQADGQPPVMLSIAYKHSIRQVERFHWPELCYQAQGFETTRLPPSVTNFGAVRAGVSRFIAERQERIELVHYIMRIGSDTPVGSVAVRSAIFRDNLAMQIPDGTLTRISLLLPDKDASSIRSGSVMLQKFLTSFYVGLDTGVGRLIV